MTVYKILPCDIKHITPLIDVLKINHGKYKIVLINKICFHMIKVVKISLFDSFLWVIINFICFRCV